MHEMIIKVEKDKMEEGPEGVVLRSHRNISDHRRPQQLEHKDEHRNPIISVSAVETCASTHVHTCGK